MKHKIGTVDREGVFIEVKYPDTLAKDGHKRLSISADIRRSGHCVGGGQALHTVRRVATHGTLAKDWPEWRIRKLLYVWEYWHLNDVRAGCEHQVLMGWTYNDHPSKPCPMCGYEMGSAWQYEPLPLDVERFVQELA